MDTTTLFTAPSWSADPARCFDVWPSGLLPRDAHAHLADQIGHLDRLLGDYQPTRAIDRYLASPVERLERLDRWATLVLLREVGLLPLRVLPDRPDWSVPGHTKRVFTDLEHGALRAVSLANPFDAVTVALSEAGATGHDLHRIDPSWLTEPDTDQWLVDLPGDSRTHPRRIQLAAWSRPALTQLLQQRPASGALLYTGTADDPEKRRSSMLMRLRKLVRYTGLDNDASVSPESLRHTGARQTYDADPQGGLQAAANVLGLGDLDKVAHRLDLDRQEPSPVLIRWPR